MEVVPVAGPLDATVTVPGSKSLTNRALVAAALADGTSEIVRPLEADDTDAMAACLAALGVVIRRQPDRWIVEGRERPAPGPARLDAHLSGTTARFIAPVVALGEGAYTLDGGPSLRTRPMAPMLDALRSLGAQIVGHGEPGHLPVTITAGGLFGGTIRVRADLSSQFVSGLLLAAPRAKSDLVIEVEGDVVSRPFLDLTVRVMHAFGAPVETDAGRFAVPAGGYRPAEYRVEPDASSASYFFAAAAICGGRVTVEGLGSGTTQGDARFADVLASMGAIVERTATSTTVVGGPLVGVDVDLAEMGDVALTLAAVAVFADGPTRVRGVGYIRRHETDRIAAVVKELGRCGVRAEETEDGFIVHPGTPHGAEIHTYDDHRVAMSFALLGLRVPGIRITDAACVGKTFPGFWDVLASLTGR
jgi:3-phosphoshikimate 1-carboxyvinyltransferase